MSRDGAAAVLLRTPRLLVTRAPHPSATCVVTFSSYEDAAAEDRTAFGAGFLDRNGIDAVHVVGLGNDWFQHDDMPGAIAAIRAAAAGKRLVTYGSSMGGYAAIRFSGALGATEAIAISPQFALDPRAVPFERRWRKEARQVRFLSWPEVASPPPAVVFFDPHNPDGKHAELWARDRKVVRIPLPYAGHPAGTFLSQVGLLAPAVLQILRHGFDPAALTRDAFARRRSSPQYIAGLSGAQPPSRRGVALDLMHRAVRLAPGNAHHTSQLAMLLYRAGRDEEAEQAHRRAVALSDGNPVYLFRYSLFQQRLGRFGDAVALARLASDTHPDGPGMRRHLRRVQRLAGPLGPVCLWLRLANAGTHLLNRSAWRRGWSAVGRLARP